MVSHASQLIVAIRLRLLTNANGIDLSTFEILQINFATLFYGLFLPAGHVAGIAIRFYRISRPQGENAGSLISLILDRIAAATSLCVIGIVAWLLAFPIESWPFLVLMSSVLVALLVLQGVFLIDWSNARLGALGERLVRRAPKKLTRRLA